MVLLIIMLQLIIIAPDNGKWRQFVLFVMQMAITAKKNLITALRTMAHLTTHHGLPLPRMEFQRQAPVLMKEIQVMQLMWRYKQKLIILSHAQRAIGIQKSKKSLAGTVLRRYP
jgi:hypothetical protein